MNENILLNVILPAILKYLAENPQVVEKLVAALVALIVKAIENANQPA